MLDDTLDEIFEQTDSEDYNENDMEEIETDVSGDTERWADDSIFKNISFDGNLWPGIFTHKKVRPTSEKTFSRQTILRSDLHTWCLIILLLRRK
ncbi:hypothetical protein AVEN_196147-1 [Araneus ventricosus]|uniref:Uncharacterized protein n=1 Tax=Araneus ventricosus TaxID=182803 RepID=A0A4Y2E0V4_ARAVE|nr:hypothetical protein AVEN_196147-1 [Araneus ventricosus]